jgi:hypothetical protein
VAPCKCCWVNPVRIDCANRSPFPDKLRRYIGALTVGIKQRGRLSNSPTESSPYSLGAVLVLLWGLVSMLFLAGYGGAGILVCLAFDNLPGRWIRKRSVSKHEGTMVAGCRLGMEPLWVVYLISHETNWINPSDRPFGCLIVWIFFAIGHLGVTAPYEFVKRSIHRERLGQVFDAEIIILTLHAFAVQRALPAIILPVKRQGDRRDSRCVPASSTLQALRAEESARHLRY